MMKGMQNNSCCLIEYLVIIPGIVTEAPMKRTKFTWQKILSKQYVVYSSAGFVLKPKSSQANSILKLIRHPRKWINQYNSE